MKETNNVLKYYSKISGIYEKVRLGNIKNKLISDIQVDWFIRNLKNSCSTCLEVGCGTGRVTQVIIKHVKHLIATDGSIEMIRINKNNMKSHQLRDKIEYVLCDASILPFREECFNSFIGARVFWHISDYPRALKEGLRVVKTNEPILFDFPCLLGPFSIISKLCRSRYEVLTEFINRKTLGTVFRKAKHLIINGNTSIILFLIPNKIFKHKTVIKLIYLLESLDYGFLKDLFFSYYLIKVIK